MPGKRTGGNTNTAPGHLPHRALSWGNVRQLEAVSRRLLVELAARAPVLPDAAALMWLDVDSCQRRVYGHAKQGAGFGHAKVGGYSVRLRGLNPLIAAISTPTRRTEVSDGLCKT